MEKMEKMEKKQLKEFILNYKSKHLKKLWSRYNFKEFNYCRIIKDDYFAYHNAMDWLEGEWIIISDRKINNLEKIKIPKLSIDNEMILDQESLIGLIESIQKYWPFKVNIEGKDYNILPVFDYLTDFSEEDLKYKIIDTLNFLCEYIKKELGKIIRRNLRRCNSSLQFQYWLLKPADHIRFLNLNIKNINKKNDKFEYNQITL